MASRLDKLFELLESNNSSIRGAAAIQIGKISTNSQVQIPLLLNKLLHYIKHKQWSVRIAAADALRNIGLNTKLWVPNASNSNSDMNLDFIPKMISLDKLDLLEILRIGNRLYSIDIKDLDETINLDSSICKDEISRHIDFIIPGQYEINSIVKDEDYEVFKSKDTDHKISVEKAVEKSLEHDNKKGIKRSHSESSDIYEPSSKMSNIMKQETREISREDENHFEWPWIDFCNKLLVNLWNAKWEIRHGAATCLRELVRSQGSVMICKVGYNLSRSDFTLLHVRYLEDVVGRLLCTLALDQLSDFVSDEMVAPVRESCAQVIGVISVHLTESVVKSLAEKLLSLLDFHEWTVNHGALLGLKYLLAARLDLAESLLPMLYGPISNHLKENCDDDVRCAAAAALMPIFNKTANVTLQSYQLESLRLDLWNLLALRPDYTSSGATCAVLQLLEKLYQCNESMNNGIFSLEKQFDTYINHLHWCYYSYSDSVRLASLRTCSAVLLYYIEYLSQISTSTLSHMMSQLIQRVLIDENQNVVLEAENLWNWIIEKLSSQKLAQSCVERLDVWMCCAMQPARLSYALDVILMPNNESSNEDCKHQFPKEFFIGGRESFLSEGCSLVREEIVLKARLAASRLLAGLCNKLSNIDPLAEHILITIITQIHLKERLAVQRFVVAAILAYWNPKPDWVVNNQMMAPLRQQLLSAIEDSIYYQELLPVFRQMIKSCRDLISCYNEQKIEIPINNTLGKSTLSLGQCQALVVPELYNRLKGEAELTLSTAKTSVDLCTQQQINLTRMVEVSLGRALLHWGWLPEKLTPLIKPLVDAVRFDDRFTIQNEASIALGQLVIDQISNERLKAAIGKLVKNLVQYVSDSIDTLSPSSEISNSDIIALNKITQIGRDAYPCQEDMGPIDVASNSALIKLRGSRLALERIFGNLITKEVSDQDISLLLQIIYHHPIKLLLSNSNQDTSQSGISLLASLRAMVTCLPFIRPEYPTLGVSLLKFSETIFQYGLCHSDSIIRHWSARILAILMMPSSVQTDLDLNRQCIDKILLGQVLVALNSSSDINMCLGSIELLYLIMHKGLFQYRLALVVIVLPVVLRNLNTPFEPVRRMATNLFSLLLCLLPLEQANADISILTPVRQEERKSKIQFLEGLLNPDSIPPYDAYETNLSTCLRHYQKQGVNWLSFLNQYGLHGVLADDMGLGKTLQTISIIVGEYSRCPANCPPSLIICPPTLTNHWHQEIAKHVTIPGFSSIVYAGSVDNRQQLFQNLHQYQIIITSYDILRNDIDRLSHVPNQKGLDCCSGLWNYIVLDEGHLIRNHKSKIAIAAKSVNAMHRLVLTGTPIQNRVAELWSLFDFLMPGLLGTHSEFQKRYGRLLDQSSSTSGKKVDSEAGALALDQLHQQVLPFMLRRVKEDVLHELPPKIMQDYICTMTPLQSRLYAFCMESKQSINNKSTDDMGNLDLMSVDQRKHIFQAMHYLRLVCNHPTLALCETHPLYQSITKELEANNLSLTDIDLSGKLVALKQLILDCGIGADDSNISMGPCELICSPGVVSSHRLLVFCQSKSMISLVERMLNTEIPKASHLRLDGSVPMKDRQKIVDKFNQDASIDLLLLTTSIGGLGLNLTSADIVIFVEHDWNPMRDLQAMDRAHRIGQRNTVNVYRLITADSIEEKIMNLQKFKMFIANNVVGSDNKQMGSMNTESILDIMNKEAWSNQLSTAAAGGSANQHNSTFKSSSSSGIKSVLSKMEHVYDSIDEYDEEYNLESFVKKL